MTAVLILLMFVAFVGIDFVVRTTLRRMRSANWKSCLEIKANFKGKGLPAAKRRSMTNDR